MLEHAKTGEKTLSYKDFKLIFVRADSLRSPEKLKKALSTIENNT